MGKVARLSIYWQDAACRFVIPLRQVALAQLNKYHHQSGNLCGKRQASLKVALRNKAYSHSYIIQVSQFFSTEKHCHSIWHSLMVWNACTFCIIVGFFIPVSSLKVFSHSIHSERRRIYLGDQYKLFRLTPLSYHDYSVSGSSTQQCSGIGLPLKLLCLFSSLLVPHKNFFCQVPNKYRSLMTFRNKIQAKTFTWPDMLFYAP